VSDLQTGLHQFFYTMREQWVKVLTPCVLQDGLIISDCIQHLVMQEGWQTRQIHYISSWTTALAKQITGIYFFFLLFLIF
jgi:hypothetical protein